MDMNAKEEINRLWVEIEKGIDNIEITSGRGAFKLFSNEYYQYKPFIPESFALGLGQEQKYKRILVVGDSSNIKVFNKTQNLNKLSLENDQKLRRRIEECFGMNEKNGEELLNNIAYYQFFLGQKFNEGDINFYLQVFSSVLKAIQPSQLLIVGDKAWSLIGENIDVLVEIKIMNCFLMNENSFAWDGFLDDFESVKSFLYDKLEPALEKINQLNNLIKEKFGTREKYNQMIEEERKFYEEHPDDLPNGQTVDEVLENIREDFFECGYDKYLELPVEVAHEFYVAEKRTEFFNKQHNKTKARVVKKNVSLLSRIIDFLLEKDLVLPEKKISEAMMYVDWLNKIGCPNEEYYNALEWALSGNSELPERLKKIPGIVNKPNPYPNQNKGVPQTLNMAFTWLKNSGAKGDLQLAKGMRTYFIKRYDTLKKIEEVKGEKDIFWEPKNKEK